MPLISADSCTDRAAGDEVSSAFAAPPAVVRWTRGSMPSATLCSCRIAAARSLDNDAFIDAVASTYRSLWHRIQRSPHPHLVRLWNGVPGINDQVDASRDRYMLFNAGRYLAMRDWYGGADLAGVAPAASGVGIDGDDFVVHALSLATPGESIQNPRQTPAAHYSRRYGPLPPCFARATRVTLQAKPVLLVSGTAAILGEASMYDGDLDHQLSLTIENLSAVVDAAGGAASGRSLEAYSSLRVYLPRRADRPTVEPALRRAARDDCDIEFVPARLCRPELLVEIEGVADLAAD